MAGSCRLTEEICLRRQRRRQVCFQKPPELAHSLVDNLNTFKDTYQELCILFVGEYSRSDPPCDYHSVMRQERPISLDPESHVVYDTRIGPV